MRKSKVQPFATRVFGRRQVMLLLRASHFIPLALLPGVSTHLENLDADHKDDIVRDKPKQDLVTGTMIRLILVLVYVGCDYRRGLNRHVVQSRANSARAHGSGVARRQRHEDWMDLLFHSE